MGRKVNIRGSCISSTTLGARGHESIIMGYEGSRNVRVGNVDTDLGLVDRGGEDVSLGGKSASGYEQDDTTEKNEDVVERRSSSNCSRGRGGAARRLAAVGEAGDQLLLRGDEFKALQSSRSGPSFAGHSIRVGCWEKIQR